MEHYGDLRNHKKREVDLHKIPFDWIFNTTKYSFYGGCFLGFHRALLHKGTLDWTVHVREVLRFSVPMAAMGLTYTSCTFLAQHFREKDGRWNHILGTLPAIGLLHAFTKSAELTRNLGPLMILAAVAYAESQLFDWPNIFHGRVERGRFEELTFFPDLSVIKDRKGWTY